MGKLPAFQFYPGDWLQDPIAGCSLAAQGLWLRMMMIAHTSDRYGYLSSNGAAIPSDSIARRCGCTPEAYVALLDELDRAGVPSRTEGGVIFSRRMVRDDKERADSRARQHKRYNKLKTLVHTHGDITPILTPFSEDEGEVERPSSSKPTGELRPKPATSPPPLPSPEADVSLFSRVLCEQIGVFGIQEQSSMHKLFDSYVRHSGRELGQAVEHMTARWEQYQEAIPVLSWTYGSAFKFFMSGQWNKPEQWPRKEPERGRSQPGYFDRGEASRNDEATRSYFLEKAKAAKAAGQPLTELQEQLLREVGR